MKTIVCLLTSVWLILVAGFSFASVDINEVVAGKEIRSFGSITQTERWERFDRVISGYKEVGAFPSTILGHFAYTSAKNNGYLVLVHPDFRSYKAYVAEYIRYNNLDEEISITEFENRNLSTNEKDWFYFPVHREYLQNESQKTDSVTMSQVDTIGNRLAEIPLIQAEITKLNKRVEEVINRPLSGSVGDSKSFIALKNEVEALTKRMDGWQSSQEPLSTGQVDSVQKQLASLQLIADQLTNASEAQGETRVVLDQESIIEILTDRQFVTNYIVPFAYIILAVLLFWFFIKFLFWLIFRRRWANKKISKAVAELKKEFGKSMETLEQSLNNKVNALDGDVNRVKDNLSDLGDEVNQVRNQTNSIVDRLSTTELRSSVIVDGLEKLDSVKGDVSIVVTVSSTLDDTPSYKVFFKNKDSNNFLVYGVWRDEDKKGDPEIVYLKNTDFRKTFIRAYVKNRLSVKIDDEKEVIAA